MGNVSRQFIFATVLLFISVSFVAANEKAQEFAPKALDYFSIDEPQQKNEARLEIERFKAQILYSNKYVDATSHEYRHVLMPLELKKYIPRNRLLTEEEWRQFGVQMSSGWQHYMIHKPERHVLLFKRPLPRD